MKRILPVFLFVASLLSALAGTYYPAKDGSWTFNDGVFTFNANYVWTGFALRPDDKYSHTSLDLNDLVEMGYYKIENGKAGAPMVMFQRGDTGEMAIKNSVILEKGDKIGVYAKIQSTTQDHYENEEVGHYNKKGKWVIDGYRKILIPGETIVTTWTTTANAIPGARTNTNNVDHDSLMAGSDPQYFCLFLDHSIGRVAHFEYYLSNVISGDNYDDFISEVIDANTGDDGEPITVITDITGEPVTTGQPLPGLLLTLACGGAATGLCTRKRKRSAKA